MAGIPGRPTEREVPVSNDSSYEIAIPLEYVGKNPDITSTFSSQNRDDMHPLADKTVQ